jgi:ATP-dependent exoDNAse (exonuclease V) alpha subunit
MADIYEQKLEEHFVHTPTQEQHKLMQLLVSFLFHQQGNQIFLLRGYAGTGKTSMISAMVKLLLHQRVPVVLMAPTGRAAKVLSAYSQYWSSTIHRRIYFALTDANGNLVLRLQKNKLKKAVFLVDEASMIANDRGDARSGGRILLDDLMEFVYAGEQSKLILVGDVAQLPPVGLNVSPALNTVHLQNAYHYPVTKYELTQVVRQQKESGILSNATRLRNIMLSKDYQMPFLDDRGFKDVLRIHGSELADEVQSCYDFIGQDDTVIITRSNKNAYQYNQAIRHQILGREQELEAGDMLMVVKNNYWWLEQASRRGFLANGDILELMGIYNMEEKFGFHFADADIRMIDYDEDNLITIKVVLDSLSADGPALSAEDNNKLYYAVLNSYSDIADQKVRKEKVRNDPYFNAVQIKYAYALTCHKTQGGQWHTVFVDQGYIQPDGYNLDYLRWMYTAITRATHRLYLINFPDDLFS